MKKWNFINNVNIVIIINFFKKSKCSGLRPTFVVNKNVYVCGVIYTHKVLNWNRDNWFVLVWRVGLIVDIAFYNENFSDVFGGFEKKEEREGKT